MVLTQSELLEVREAPGKGRGVFARVDIPKGTVLEEVPVLVFESDKIEDSELMNYVFVWGKTTVALALGYGSLYNHSYSPNARYYDGRNRLKQFMSIRDIQAGDEITINYNGSPRSRAKVDFSVIENPALSVPSTNGHRAGSNGRVPHQANGAERAPGKKRATAPRRR